MRDTHQVDAFIPTAHEDLWSYSVPDSINQQKTRGGVKTFHSGNLGLFLKDTVNPVHEEFRVGPRLGCKRGGHIFVPHSLLIDHARL
jgi:hypothetical protein